MHRTFSLVVSSTPAFGRRRPLRWERSGSRTHKHDIVSVGYVCVCFYFHYVPHLNVFFLQSFGAKRVTGYDDILYQ